MVDAVNRIRGPFNVNAPSIAAGVAALADVGHVERSREHNEKWLAWLTEEIRKIGLKVTPSVGNFLLIHFPETKGKTAKDADALLTSRGLVLRAVGAYHLPNALRMQASVTAPRTAGTVISTLFRMNCAIRESANTAA